MTLDSDNEFGYDFSVEEEELLFQLASENNTPAPQHNAKISAIDAVPGRTENLLGQDVVAEIGNTSAFGLDNLQTASMGSLYNEQRRDQRFEREESSCLPTPPAISSVEDIFYPDCTW